MATLGFHDHVRSSIQYTLRSYDSACMVARIPYQPNSPTMTSHNPKRPAAGIFAETCFRPAAGEEDQLCGASSQIMSMRSIWNSLTVTGGTANFDFTLLRSTVVVLQLQCLCKDQDLPEKLWPEAQSHLLPLFDKHLRRPRFQLVDSITQLSIPRHHYSTALPKLLQKMWAYPVEHHRKS